MKNRQQKVAILVLNYNGNTILNDCISSLRKTIYSNLEIFVIDNGSTDNSTESVDRVFPEIKLICFDENLGFCEAYNKASKEVDADYLLFLNNDITVSNPNWLEEMVKLILGNSQIGVVGAKLLLPSNLNLIENVGGDICKWQGGTRIGTGEKDEGQYNGNRSLPFYISGASFLIKKSLFIEAGGFDSEMFAYSEDLDLCWRLRLMGYKIQTCPNAILIHRLSASWKKSMKSLYLSNRNFIRASMKNYSFGNLLKNIPPLLMTSLVFGFLATLISRNGTFLLNMLKSIIHNVIHCGSTVKARQVVQKKRMASDQTVFKDTQNCKIESISAISKKLEVFV